MKITILLIILWACTQAQEIEKVSPGVVVIATEPIYTMNPDLAVRGNILHGLRARQAQLPRCKKRQAPLGCIGDIVSTLFCLATAIV